VSATAQSGRPVNGRFPLAAARTPPGELPPLPKSPAPPSLPEPPGPGPSAEGDGVPAARHTPTLADPALPFRRASAATQPTVPSPLVSPFAVPNSAALPRVEQEPIVTAPVVSPLAPLPVRHPSDPAPPEPPLPPSAKAAPPAGEPAPQRPMPAALLVPPFEASASTQPTSAVPAVSSFEAPAVAALPLPNRWRPRPPWCRSRHPRRHRRLWHRRPCRRSDPRRLSARGRGRLPLLRQGRGEARSWPCVSLSCADSFRLVLREGVNRGPFLAANHSSRDSIRL
jgi:hypothetical protein